MGVGKSKIKVPADSVSGWVLFLIFRHPSFNVSSVGGRGKGALWGLIYKGTNPIYEGFTLMT